MRVPNRSGVAVDPIPFVVVSGTATLLLLSFGPLYGQALGVPLSVAVGGSLALCAVSAVVAYYRQIWTASAVIETPAGLRAERLFYLMAILGVVAIGLAIPLLV